MIGFLGKKADRNKGKRTIEHSEAQKKELMPEISEVSQIGARESQQDSYYHSDLSDYVLAHEKGILAVVADGMGGLANGAEISGIVTASMKEYFSKVPFSEDVSSELVKMIHVANQDARKYIRNTSGDVSGSTVVAVDFIDGKLYFASVGDSRIYLVRRGGMIQLNREHVYIRDLLMDKASGNIGMDEFMKNNEKKALTHFIGMDELDQIDFNLNPVKILPHDKVVLMTDGVFGTLSENEMCKAMRMSADNAARRIDECIAGKKKPTQDNYTALIMDFN